MSFVFVKIEGRLILSIVIQYRYLCDYCDSIVTSSYSIKYVGEVVPQDTLPTGWKVVGNSITCPLHEIQVWSINDKSQAIPE